MTDKRHIHLTTSLARSKEVSRKKQTFLMYINEISMQTDPLKFEHYVITMDV